MTMLTHISQLEPVDEGVLSSAAEELIAAGIDWSEPYPEYASNGLNVATLLTPDGTQGNFDYRDCRDPKPTPLLSKLPAIEKYLKTSGFHIMSSRLLRLEPGTFLHEHRDYVYLENVPRFRLHMPLITNERAFITVPGKNVHLRKGFLWKLNPKDTIHSACNFGDKARIHLMLDCYVNDRLAGLIEKEFLQPELCIEMPGLQSSDRKALVRQSCDTLARGQLRQAEEMVLKAFCLYNLGDVTTYDLLFDVFAGKPEYSERVRYWTERLHEVYPERATAPSTIHLQTV